jgi:hypothetical protein
MSSTLSELEKWLLNSNLVPSESQNNQTWEAGFDADRQVVRAKLGNFYQKLFLRPDVFVKRFYHELFPLPIEEWHYQESLELYEGFCTLKVDVELRFQATLEFAQRNDEALPDINEHIKNLFKGLIADLIHQQLQQLSDGQWVHTGLTAMQQQISLAICEMLMVQDVQSQAICSLQAEFQEFPNIKTGKDNVYLHVLKQSYEVTEKKSQAFFEQQLELKEQKITQKQQNLEYFRQLAMIERERKAQEADNRLLVLQDQEQQLRSQLEVETRIHIEKIRHQQELKQIEMNAELQAQNEMKALRRQSESQQLAAQLAHQAELEEQKAAAEIARREKQQQYQSRMMKEKTLAEVSRYEKQQETWREAKLRIHEQQLELKKRQKILETEAEEELTRQEQKIQQNPIVMPFQKLEKFEDRDKARRKSEALRNEIELNLLEKQRLDLEMAINAAQQKTHSDDE